MRNDKATKVQPNHVPAQNARTSFSSGQAAKPNSNTGSTSNNVQNRNPPSVGKNPPSNNEAGLADTKTLPIALNSQNKYNGSIKTPNGASNTDGQNSINEMTETSQVLMNYSQTDRIPATKFTINKHVTNMFSNPKALADEIIRHKKINKKNIKKVSLFGNTVIIATDNLDTKRILQEEWPADVFKNGINFIKTEPRAIKTKVKMVIFAKKVEIDLECPDIKEQLLSQGIIEAHHVASKANAEKKNGNH